MGLDKCARGIVCSVRIFEHVDISTYFSTKGLKAACE